MAEPAGRGAGIGSVAAQAAALGGVATAAFLVGRWSASRSADEAAAAAAEEAAAAAAQHKGTRASRPEVDGGTGGGGGTGSEAADSAAGEEARASQMASAQWRSAALTEFEATQGTDELVRLLGQLPPKPIGAQDQGEPHSTAKIILLCASGKGGVGKSTVSVNLAFTLATLGLEVGLLDLDIYGPSLPELVRLPPGPVMQNKQGLILPLDYGGVALMSWGYIQPGEAATIRAPILAQITTQLLNNVEWGALDVLVVDSPPGTGDVLLSISQTLAVDGAVLVTTCNNISFADVVKGVQLFEKVSIPPLLVVANMATHECSGCGHTDDLFADDAVEKLPKFLKEKAIGLVKMPLDPMLSRAPPYPMPPLAREYPFVRNPDYESRAAWRSFCGLGKAVLERIVAGAPASGAAAAASAPTMLRLRPGGSLEVRLRGGDLRPVAPCELRATCRCAECVDEFTHEVRIDCDKIRRDTSLKATKVEPRGNYAVNVVFSDGHSSLVALRALERLVAGEEEDAAKKEVKKSGDW